MVSNGGNYTKHIYMGSQRITSKVSNSGIFSSSPVEAMEQQAKLALQTAKIRERFDSLGVKYSGTQQTGGLESTNSDTTVVSTYFYHSDHLGSSSLITNVNGDMVQHIEYVPFGETFIDERNGNWHTPYLFNAKEQDEETGLHYYGARYYDSRTGVWLSVDPLAEKYPNIGSYVYCVNNPLNTIDPDGKDILFINGYIGFGSPPAGQAYWSNSFVSGAKSYFNDKRTKFTNYEPSMFSSAADRRAAGLEYAKSNFADLTVMYQIWRY